MKNILIIGIQRTGTTSLLQSFKKTKKTNVEPFNYFELPKGIVRKNKYPSDFLGKENIAVKSLIHQTPKESDLGEIEFYIEFSKHFDIIILLDRKNFNEHFLSIVNLQSKIHKKIIYNNNNNLYTFQHHTKFAGNKPWIEEDLTEADFKFAEEWNFSDKLKKDKILIKKLSDSLNVPITYYEDLYGNDRNKSLNIIKSWNLDVDESYINNFLHPKFKYKKLKRNLL